jgi:catechol 2,3-dioxygenase-like lactoylglutathione lyase family enzyme
MEVAEGGRVRHLFLNTGGDQLLAFMEPRGIPGVPVEFDASLNRPLGMPEFFYHFAFAAEGPEELAARRADLVEKGVRVTPIVDHEWAQSIYFEDPNGLLLEFSCPTCHIHADDFVRESRFEVSLAGPSPFESLRAE